MVAIFYRHYYLGTPVSNEDHSKHCLKDWNVIYGAVVQKIDLDTSSTSREEDTKRIKYATKVN